MPKGIGEAMQEFIRAKTVKTTLDEVEKAKDDNSLNDFLQERQMFSNAAIQKAKRDLEDAARE